ncbi:MAG: NAD(P)H-dependent oxidoreductase [Bacilli bacterium]|nr:NAD(P)H-dependent oxidoreductase [Bacilli bacterium]
MQSLIVYVHPWDGSFNHALKETVQTALKAKGKKVKVLDLYKDGFNPVMTSEDLKLFGQGEYNDPLAKDYVNNIKNADEIIFIYPLWWYGEPAILSGFFDKVFLKGHVYKDGDNYNIVPLLNINKATVITTASLTKDGLKTFGDPIKKRLIEGIFKMVGINNVTWLHAGSVHKAEVRTNFINEIKNHFQ